MSEASLAVVHPSSLLRVVEHDWFKRGIIVLIVISAILLGLETIRELPASLLDAVFRINRAILGLFVIEIVLRVSAHKLSFFRDPWNLFDFAIVGVALMAPSGPLQVLRALRILRAMRLVSAIPSLRRVVAGLLGAVPGIASVLVLLALVLYIAAVMATLLFRDVAPEYFDHLGITLFSLFQIMTLEGWSVIATEVMAQQGWAWVFFVSYILVATFLVLNLVIGVVVDGIQSQIRSEATEDEVADPALKREVVALRREFDKLRDALGRGP